jgi:UDP-glucose 4-epimerase
MATCKTILLTGGLGYIGSHCCIELIGAGYDPIIIDNLSNSKISVLDRLKLITQKDNIPFYQADVADKNALNAIFAEHDIDAVMHFAGYKAVGKSTKIPLAYYRNNLDTTLTLLEIMQEHDVQSFIFSSSATVYGEANTPPFTEKMPTGSGTNPYGRTKYMIEEILKDCAFANPAMSVSLLRYFNPVGADGSGMIGEDPNGIPNNLMPYIQKVASGELPDLSIFGDDYNTSDGTCVRDYIHVSDLARGHVAALEKKHDEAGVHIYNLGTGTGISVKEMVEAYGQACGKPIPYKIAPRREGDLPEFYADVSKAQEELNWTASKSLNDMVKDSWNWVNNNLRTT